MERPNRANASLLQLHPAVGILLEQGRYMGCLHALADVLGGMDASPLEQGAVPLNVEGGADAGRMMHVEGGGMRGVREFHASGEPAAKWTFNELA